MQGFLAVVLAPWLQQSNGSYDEVLHQLLHHLTRDHDRDQTIGLTITNEISLEVGLHGGDVKYDFNCVASVRPHTSGIRHPSNSTLVRSMTDNYGPIFAMYSGQTSRNHGEDFSVS